jgi:acyl carrier protein
MNNQKENIKLFILSQLKDKLLRLGIGVDEISEDFDLVKSGMLDSMSFVDLVVSIEQHYGIEVDFEIAFLQPSFTCLSGLAETISKEIK